MAKLVLVLRRDLVVVDELLLQPDVYNERASFIRRHRFGVCFVFEDGVGEFVADLSDHLGNAKQPRIES